MTKSKQSSSSTDLPPSWEWRGGRLRIRKKWPAWVLKVRPDLKGKDFTKSLGTSDLKAADRSAALALAEFHSLCDAYVTPKPPANAVEWIYSLPDGDASEASESHFNLAQIEMAKAYASQLPTMVAALLSDDAKARIADLIRTELDATIRDDAQRLRELSYPEELPQGDPQRADDKPLTADALLAAWQSEKKSAPATLKKYAATFRTISKCLGFDDVRRITPDDVVKFKEARIADRISIGTIEDDIRAAGGVCRWGVKNRKLGANLNRPGFEPPRVCRRLFGLSHAAKAGCSSAA